jgi:ABC-type phosphate transport system substrate-binding protein
VKNLSPILGLALGAALAGTHGSAQAQTECSSLTDGQLVVVGGSSAMGTLMTYIGPILANASGNNQYQILYVGPGSCAGVKDVAEGIKVTGSASYWPNGSQPGSAASTCTLPEEGVALDLGLSDVFIESCPSSVVSDTDKAKLKQEPLLVLPFGFIAPNPGSQAVSIDAREAYYVYGKGSTANVTPWNATETLGDKTTVSTDHTLGPVFQRDQTSGTQITIFKNIHLKVDAALGQDAGGTGAMISAVAGSNSPLAALGFASLDAVDLKRDVVKILAYRHWGQDHFYWPDATSNTFEKINVRDGHYPLWSYEHAIYLKDNPSAVGQKLLKLLDGTTPLPSSDINTVIVKSHLIPTCAMSVARTADAGDFTPADLAEPCGCFFEKNVQGGSTDCDTCKKDTDCGSGKACVLGYCESTGSK